MSQALMHPLASYKTRRDKSRVRVLDSYDIIGYIAAGTYGKVYKARSKTGPESNKLVAIKKFKTDKEGEVVHYTGISQSACREMALCREIDHRNIIKLTQIIMEDKCIYMAFEYAEHDLLQIIHHHTHSEQKLIPESILKSVLWQLLNGVSYLHQNWIIHRDLKPANIMLTANGIVKIGDLGLARLFKDPLQSLYAGDKVVVTIWYRAPELLLGGRHYTPSIDLWAVGCIFAELLALRPIFKGEETKADNNFNNGGGKKVIPFQKNQFQKVIDILGFPTTTAWPSMINYPDYASVSSLKPGESDFNSWCHKAFDGYSTSTTRYGAALLANLFAYDPARRETANNALLHPFFTASGGVRITLNAFDGQKYDYPTRRILSDDVDIMAVSYSGSNANTKRSAVVSGETTGRGRKRKLG